MFPSKFICRSPKPHVTLFGARAFKERIKIKGDNKGVPNLIGLVSLWEEEETRKRKKHHVYREEFMWAHRKKVAICEAVGESSPEANTAETLIWVLASRIEGK